jgi:hypothetical protein
MLYPKLIPGWHRVGGKVVGCWHTLKKNTLSFWKLSVFSAFHVWQGLRSRCLERVSTESAKVINLHACEHMLTSGVGLGVVPPSTCSHTVTIRCEGLKKRNGNKWGFSISLCGPQTEPKGKSFIQHYLQNANALNSSNMWKITHSILSVKRDASSMPNATPCIQSIPFVKRDASSMPVTMPRVTGCTCEVNHVL